MIRHDEDGFFSMASHVKSDGFLRCFAMAMRLAGGLHWLTKEQVATIYRSIAGEDQEAGISTSDHLSGGHGSDG